MPDVSTRETVSIPDAVFTRDFGLPACDLGACDLGARGPQLAEDEIVLLLHAPRLHNRLPLVLAHTCRYAFEGQARLAKDVGVSRSTVSRLIGGRTRPHPALMRRVTEALAVALGRSLTARELFSPDGTYPTPSGCDLCNCPGCLPEYAFDRQCRRRPEFRAMQPGDWTLSTGAFNEHR